MLLPFPPHYPLRLWCLPEESRSSSPRAGNCVVVGKRENSGALSALLCLTQIGPHLLHTRLFRSSGGMLAGRCRSCSVGEGKISVRLPRLYTRRCSLWGNTLKMMAPKTQRCVDLSQTNCFSYEPPVPSAFPRAARDSLICFNNLRDV